MKEEQQTKKRCSEEKDLPLINKKGVIEYCYAKQRIIWR